MKDLATVRYDDISSYEEELTADDIEDLQSGYFTNSIKLIKEFVRHEQVHDELIARYSLGSLKMDWEDEYDEDDDYDFPSEGLKDSSRMTANIRSRWISPDRIVKKEVKRMLPFITFSNGKEVLYTNNESQDMVIRRYTPQGSKKCFCQMCQNMFIPEIIKTLNVVFLPKAYWPELRVALCPMCASRFTELRRNQSFLKQFYAKLINMDISIFNDDIKISIADTKLRFTYRHIMEIREILRDHRKELSNADDYEDR